MVTLAVSIWTAAQFGDETTLRRKTEQNPKLLQQADDYGYTPLHYAAQNGHEKIVKYLLSQNVPVDLEKCGATPLHRAGKLLVIFFSIIR
jgi:ankyrin repeat protein